MSCLYHYHWTTGIPNCPNCMKEFIAVNNKTSEKNNELSIYLMSPNCKASDIDERIIPILDQFNLEAPDNCISPLMASILIEHTELFLNLIDRVNPNAVFKDTFKNEFNDNFKDEFNDTMYINALDMAISKKRTDMIMVLLSKGAHINLHPHPNIKLLDRDIQKHIEKSTIFPCFKFNFKSIHAALNFKCKTCLYSAIENASAEQLNEKDDKGRTPLQRAILMQDADAIRKLIEHGA